MGGWTPEMTSIAEATPEEKKMFSEQKDTVIAYFK